MCESVYVGLCQIVGTSEQVAMRRETADIVEMVKFRALIDNDSGSMFSGSWREGFRLPTSDIDYMIWPNSHRVIWNLSEIEYCSTGNKTLILTDSSESPPGYTLLEMLTPTTDERVQSACVRFKDKIYISSSQYRRFTVSLSFPGAREHGPCSSGKHAGMEYDHAYCFVSDFWPPSASCWRRRSLTWPIPDIAEDIVKSGCHFVSISHSSSLHEQNEWRISFSLAEYKLVKSMTHSQFLVYGLLKIFLKEVVNSSVAENNKVLCSYHMKTAVFWVIQQDNILSWGPTNFFQCFWVCFKRIIKWVYEGVCPNFFIPQNNMFLSKVHGSAETILFQRLYKLYEKGITCLLESSSIRIYFTNYWYNPTLHYICGDNWRKYSELYYDVDLMKEIYGVYHSVLDLHHCLSILHSIEHFLGQPLTQNQFAMLQKSTTFILQVTAFIFNDVYSSGKHANRLAYKVDKLSCYMLKLASKFGFVTDMLYIAMFYNKTCRYRKAMSVIQLTKAKLEKPCLRFQGQVDLEWYDKTLKGRSFCTKIRHAVPRYIHLPNQIGFINEIYIENISSDMDMMVAISIPSFVLILFVEFLCYRHIDTNIAQAAVNTLHLLIDKDYELYAIDLNRDISWQMLGICHQFTGDLQSALDAYRKSLSQSPDNHIKHATAFRLVEKYISNFIENFKKKQMKMRG